MNTQSDSKIQLIDIVLPPPPPEMIDHSLILILVLGFSFVATYLIYKAYRSGMKYKVLIFLLKNKLNTSKITPRQAAYDLADILQAAHNTNHLATINRSMTNSQKVKWLTFSTTLSEFRYSDHKISSRDILMLLDDAVLWTARIRP